MATAKQTADQLKALNQFLAKSDARDKFCAVIQYGLLFVSAGTAGRVKNAQASVASARKVFRILKPIETLTPVIAEATGSRSPLATEAPALWALRRAQAILLAVYFGGDHITWAKSAGVVDNTEFARRIGDLSLWSWFGGSMCKALAELYELGRLASITNKALKGIEAERQAKKSDKKSKDQAGGDQDEDEEDEDQEEDIRMRIEETRAVADAKAYKFAFSASHACVQSILALGLVKGINVKPRTLGVLGVVASAMNIYMLMPGSFAPALPKPKVKEA